MPIHYREVGVNRRWRVTGAVPAAAEIDASPPLSRLSRLGNLPAGMDRRWTVGNLPAGVAPGGWGLDMDRQTMGFVRSRVVAWTRMTHLKLCASPGLDLA